MFFTCYVKNTIFNKIFSLYSLNIYIYIKESDLVFGKVVKKQSMVPLSARRHMTRL